MKREKTAVEWLVEVFDLEMFDTFHLDKITQAKQMEKEQIESSWYDGKYNSYQGDTMEQYYESKYGKDE